MTRGPTYKARKGQQVYSHRLHIDRHDTRRLGGIHQEEQVPLPDNPSDGGDRLHRAEHVAGMRQGNQPCAWCYCPAEVIGIDGAPAVSPQAGHGNVPGQLHSTQRPADTIVLQIGRNDMVSLRQQALECHVQGIGAVESEDEALGSFAVEELVEQMAGIVEGAFGSQCHLVPGSTRVGEVLAGEAVESLIDGFGLGETGGGVIEVNHVAQIAKGRSSFTGILASSRPSRTNGTVRHESNWA